MPIYVIDIKYIYIYIDVQEYGSEKDILHRVAHVYNELLEYLFRASHVTSADGRKPQKTLGLVLGLEHESGLHYGHYESMLACTSGNKQLLVSETSFECFGGLQKSPKNPRTRPGCIACELIALPSLRKSDFLYKR